jgi:hypothetical protein
VIAKNPFKSFSFMDFFKILTFKSIFIIDLSLKVIRLIKEANLGLIIIAFLDVYQKFNEPKSFIRLKLYFLVIYVTIFHPKARSLYLPQCMHFCQDIFKD